jgi:hypothetical protein
MVLLYFLERMDNQALGPLVLAQELAHVTHVFLVIKLIAHLSVPPISDGFKRKNSGKYSATRLFYMLYIHK